ncbi:MAG: DNA replication/repair protein RecF [Anaerolineae bacterium]
MQLSHLELEHFRNYTHLELALEARCHIFHGRNAQGKTNLLEAIYYLVTTKSPLASSDREVIGWDATSEPIPYARLEGTFQRANAPVTIEATLMLETSSDPNETPRLCKQLRVNGVRRRAMDVLGQANAVLFMPQDIDLVTGSPSIRRRYLDGTLCQVDNAYCRTLSKYNRAVSQRNALLKRIRERQARPNELSYWDQQVVTLGAHVLARRRSAMRELDTYASQAHAELTAHKEHLSLRYISSLQERATEARIAPQAPAADAAAIEAIWRRALPALCGEEIGRGITVVGPHRDDLIFAIGGREASAYGSRGQQRTATLALKMAEMRLMTQAAGERPILLLDDVASELDSQRCQQLIEVVHASDQVLITTTQMDSLPPELRAEARSWHIQAGTVTRIADAAKPEAREG